MNHICSEKSDFCEKVEMLQHHPASDDINMGKWSGNFSDKFQYSKNKKMTYTSNLSEFSDDFTLGCEQNE